MRKLFAAFLAAVLLVGSLTGAGPVTQSGPRLYTSSSSSSSSGGGGSTDFANILKYTDFSSGTIGNPVSVSGLEFFASSLTYENDFVDTGFSKSAKAVINIASAGMGWNYSLFTSNSLRRYDELWHSFRIRPTSGTTFQASPYFKFFRAHNSAANDDAGGNNRGHSDIYLNNDGHFHYITETFADTQHPLAGSSTAYAPTAGEWHTFDVYYKFDSVPVDSGGQSIVRFWRDKVLVAELTDVVTMATNDSYIVDTRFNTFWNGTNYPLQQQTYNYQAIGIAIKRAGGRDDSALLTTDASGNKLIAVGY